MVFKSVNVYVLEVQSYHSTLTTKVPIPSILEFSNLYIYWSITGYLVTLQDLADETFSDYRI